MSGLVEELKLEFFKLLIASFSKHGDALESGLTLSNLILPLGSKVTSKTTLPASLQLLEVDP